jgi:hypothetical protein
VTQKIKFLFDECIGKPVVTQLAALVELSTDAVEFCHVLDFQKQGVPDTEWVPRIASEGYIVVSGDGGKRCGRAKLPRICAAHKVTHVIIGPSVHSMRSLAKVAVLLRVWDEILKLSDAPKGSRHSLRLIREIPRLIQIDPPPTPTA